MWWKSRTDWNGCQIKWTIDITNLSKDRACWIIFNLFLWTIIGKGSVSCITMNAGGIINNNKINKIIIN